MDVPDQFHVHIPAAAAAAPAPQPPVAAVEPLVETFTPNKRRCTTWHFAEKPQPTRRVVVPCPVVLGKGKKPTGKSMRRALRRERLLIWDAHYSATPVELNDRPRKVQFQEGARHMLFRTDQPVDSLLPKFHPGRVIIKYKPVRFRRQPRAFWKTSSSAKPPISMIPWIPAPVEVEQPAPVHVAQPTPAHMEQPTPVQVETPSTSFTPIYDDHDSFASDLDYTGFDSDKDDLSYDKPENEIEIDYLVYSDDEEDAPSVTAAAAVAASPPMPPMPPIPATIEIDPIPANDDDDDPVPADDDDPIPATMETVDELEEPVRVRRSRRLPCPSAPLRRSPRLAALASAQATPLRRSPRLALLPRVNYKE